MPLIGGANPVNRVSDRRKSSDHGQLFGLLTDPKIKGLLAAAKNSSKFASHHGGVAAMTRVEESSREKEEEKDEGIPEDNHSELPHHAQSLAMDHNLRPISSFQAVMQVRTSKTPGSTSPKKTCAQRAAAALLGPTLNQDRQAQHVPPRLRNSGALATCEGAMLDPASQRRQRVNRALMYGLPQLTEALEGECDDIGVKPIKTQVRMAKPPAGPKPGTAPAGPKPGSARIQPRPGAKVQRIGSVKVGSAKQHR